MPRKLPRRLDKNERTAIAEELKDAFYDLAKMRGHAFVYSHFAGSDEGRKLLRSLGDSIYKLLAPDTADRQSAADQHIEVWPTLKRLLEGRATALDLVDFMFNCTRGVPTTVKGYLEDAGFPKDKLRRMARACEDLADDFGKLNCQAIPGPLSYLFYVGKLPADHETLTTIKQFPDHLRVCAGILHNWPPKDKGSNLTARQVGKRYIAAYFAFYITFFGGKTFEDMSALLRLMRAAWLDVFPQALILASKAKDTALKRYPFLQFAEGQRSDPLTARALNVAVDRFFALNPTEWIPMMTHLDQYLKEPKYELLRKKGRTFIDLLDDF